MAHRILMQVVFTGAQVFGRAFVQAYKQAAASSAAQATSATAKEGGISLDEACRILNVRSEALKVEEIRSRFDHLFNVNAKDKGGSFYLQSKVYRAKERIDKELVKPEPPPNGPAGSEATGS
ncbi:Pam16-domain-containing protein [Lipomyces tetrasporus]|uniref:Mitochondrial import inner membrane translocase subunit TIM16 n=1 Tax=Lipomyces tetrasporus TaxID=54092 RepID=A0AAD7VUJ5_9ASCO|nr:Pam16-domain-containing protein [Lipomyces tetrasporus]KAJ8103207.1 Pam16-domain-containing protein [Lipomyces tetrasporus]